MTSPFTTRSTTKIGAFSCVLVCLMACERAPEDAPKVRTLEIRDASEPVAHLVLEELRVKELVCLVKEKCAAVQSRLDVVVAEAESKGLKVKIHDPEDDEGGLVGGYQKPGDAYFDYALLEHFGGDGFTIHSR